MIIHILAVLPILGLVAQAIHQLQIPRTAHYSECFKEDPENFVYRYEGLLNDYPGIRPGCEVQYNGGKPENSPGVWNTLRYFVMDANGVEQSVDRNGSVAVNVTDLSTKEQVLRNFTWNQVCFPISCYEGNLTRILQHCYEPYAYPYESWILNWFFPNVATKENRLGIVRRHRTVIYCQPPGKIRIPLYSSEQSFPHPITEQLLEYQLHHGIDNRLIGLISKYEFIYRSIDDGRKLMHCELKIPKESPDNIVRTFYIGVTMQEMQQVPAAQAYQFGRRQTSDIQWTSQMQREYKDWCFPPECFPNESYQCENDVDDTQLYHDGAISYTYTSRYVRI